MLRQLSNRTASRGEAVTSAPALTPSKDGTMPKADSVHSTQRFSTSVIPATRGTVLDINDIQTRSTKSSRWFL